VYADPRFDEPVRLFAVQAVGMGPFFAQEGLTGCPFGAWWERPRRVAARERGLADAIGRQLAVAVENGRLHEAMVERAQALAESEDRYRRPAECAKDIIATMDRGVDSPT
jgi:hypothetical protein